jgi:hypothetical protein
MAHVGRSPWPASYPVPACSASPHRGLAQLDCPAAHTRRANPCLPHRCHCCPDPTRQARLPCSPFFLLAALPPDRPHAPPSSLTRALLSSPASCLPHLAIRERNCPAPPFHLTLDCPRTPENPNPAPAAMRCMPHGRGMEAKDRRRPYTPKP